ncbi:MAG TPA: gliding motility-associated C-terminal domain-containing protein [Bacteroidetes bacterium]|nr:gliding motility-associated C-terminal domain-containing protein [Bacteroidota bacterium]
MNQKSTIPQLSSLLFSAFFAAFQLNAQVPTVSDCLGAIPVCQAVYSETTSTSGEGNYPGEVSPFGSCLSGEDNSTWYIFTVNQSGDFGFLLTPNNSDDDYDWGLYDITDAECGDIANDPTLLVSCNAAGGFVQNDCDAPTGATGGTVFNIQGAGCDVFPPTVSSGYTPENALVPVIEGNTYVLMVANWTGSPFGYTLDFGISDVGIFDFQNPEVSSVVFPSGCGSDQILVAMNENIKCSSLSSGAVQLEGPGGPYALNISSGFCNGNALYDKTFVITTDPPINESGTFTLTLCCLEDVCGNELDPVSFTAEIEIDPQPFVDLGPDTTFCDGTVLTFDLSQQGASYMWQDGTASPVYNISTTGNYSVTVTNACGTSSDDFSVVSVDFPPVIDIGNPAETLCPGVVLELDAFSEFSTYQWSNGATSPQISVTTGGTYSVNVTNACGTSFDEITVDYIPEITLDLPANLTPCLDDDVLLDVTNDGLVLDYLWEDGSTAPVRFIDETGLYSVSVSNDCEEKTASVNVEIIDPGALDFGDDQVLCEGETLALDASLPGSTYTWQDGQTGAQYTVSGPGLYSVVVENNCGTLTDEIEVLFEPNIEFELGEDFYFCNGPVLFDVGEHPFATYAWQDGSDSSKIMAEEPGTYWVRAESGCEVETDTVHVFPCETCDIYIPNAFSPNDDGINDLFQIYTPCPIENFRMKIFDRWGGYVFYSEIMENGWDGKAKGEVASEGIYLWVIEYEATLNGIMKSERITGDVMLMQ